MGSRFVAVDLGAGSGRVVLGTIGASEQPRRLDLEVLHRFPSEPRKSRGHLRWDFRALMQGVRTGLSKLPSRGRDVASLGVDSWGVDYGLLDAGGALLEDPVCYRDPRTDGAVERAHRLVPRAEIFRATGIQTQPFNTLFQLFAQRRAGKWPKAAARLLMIPDLVHSELSGERVGEITNASTTQLLRADTRGWAGELFERLDLPLEAMPPLVAPGTRLGPLARAWQWELGLPPIAVVAPATHDTASAVAGTPLPDGWAYLSSGTWSLLGVETTAPVLSDEAAHQNFTNEAGAEGTNRLLANIMGLWILESCRGVWAERGVTRSHEELLTGVESAPALRAFIQPDDPRFFRPRDMAAEVRAFLRETGQESPAEPAWLARIVLESLALRYAAVLGRLEQVIGRRIPGVRIVGGGSQNAFLNQATASACARAVVAGPAEATAVGNILVQAIAAGRFAHLAEARAFAASCLSSRPFEPRDAAAWADAKGRFAALGGGTTAKA